MRKGIAICSLLLLAPLAFGAQHGRAAITGSAHSNAPPKAWQVRRIETKGRVAPQMSAKARRKA